MEKHLKKACQQRKLKEKVATTPLCSGDSEQLALVLRAVRHWQLTVGQQSVEIDQNAIDKVRWKNGGRGSQSGCTCRISNVAPAAAAATHKFPFRILCLCLHLFLFLVFPLSSGLSWARTRWHAAMLSAQHSQAEEWDLLHGCVCALLYCSVCKRVGEYARTFYAIVCAMFSKHASARGRLLCDHRASVHSGKFNNNNSNNVLAKGKQARKHVQRHQQLQ